MTCPRRTLIGAIALFFIVPGSGALATTGDPLPDVDVSLERKPGRIVRQVRTDAQGNFSFGYVQEGEYVITVKPSATPVPRQVSAEVNPVAPGSTAKSFFESRSNTARSGGTAPVRYRVIVSGAGPASQARTMQSDAGQQMQFRASGGQLGGRIVAE